MVTGNAGKTEKPAVPEGYKRCSKCGEIKPATVEFFYRKVEKKCGLSCYCKVCGNAIRREKYESPEEKEKARKYHKDNIEYYREYNRLYGKKHPEKKREYRKKNKEHIKEYSKKYIEENKDKIRERKKRYRESPRGVIIARLGSVRKKTGAKIYSENLTEGFINMVFEAWEKNEILYKAEQKIKMLQESAEKRAKRTAIEEIKKRRAIYCPELQMQFETATSAANILGIDQGSISKILRGDGVKTGYKKYPNGLSFEFVHPDPIYKKQTPEERERSILAQKKYQHKYRQNKKQKST